MIKARAGFTMALSDQGQGQQTIYHNTTQAITSYE